MSTRSKADVNALVASELARIEDPSRRAALAQLLVDPELRALTWDYGPPDTYSCWIVARTANGRYTFAYCDEGFGPQFPWGAVVTGESMGMDAQWHSGLEDAAIAAQALEAPAGYMVPGPR